MKEMTVARIGIAFNPDEKVNTLSINLSEHTEILSVKATETDDKHYLQINFMCPAQNALDESEVWHEFQFLIVQFAYAHIELDNHIYIGSIDVKNDSYAIFYKKVQQDENT